MTPVSRGPLSDGASAFEVAAAVRSREVSATEVAEAALARIASRDPHINAYTLVTAERALAEARALDRRLDAGDDAGPLAGVPYAVKNLFDIEGVVTLAGSKINREREPAPADAVLVARMRAAGALLTGALNMDEYAYGFTTENTHYGPCRNPHDRDRIAGGSSGGSGAAVAAGEVPLSLGSDTNGSIRVPASLCGVFGLKPTYGRLSRRGSFPFAASLDHVGPFARSVADLALCYDALQGADTADPACANRPPEPVATLLADGRSLRIATATGYFERFASDDAIEAVSLTANALGVRARLEIPGAARARAAAFIITASEGGTLHLADLRRRANDFEPLSRDRFLAGALIPAAWVNVAQRIRAWYRAEVLKLFSEVDVIIAPATPCTATLIGQEGMTLNGESLAVRPNLGMYTQPISFIGLPVVAAPVLRPGRLPIGIQIIAAPWREIDCLRVARRLEALGILSAPLPSSLASVQA
ncbi:MAG: AtzE family amidohydrolase [Usitatibacter sp.]